MATAARRSEHEDEQSVASSASPVPADPSLLSNRTPSALDFRRYRAHRAGQSVAELATEGKVTEAAVEASLRRVRIDNVRFSPEATGIAVRKLLLNHVREMDQAVSSALKATRLRTRQVIKPDPMTGELQTLEESEEYPDHATRMEAINTTRALVSVVQPKDPAVVVNTNTQTNVLNQGPQLGPGQAGLTSPEAVIRMIQNKRGLALAAGTEATKVIDAEPLEGDDGEDEDEDGDDDGEDAEYVDEEDA